MAVDDDNEVRLRGRVSADPAERVLPSGDRVVSVRLVVPRPPNKGRPGACVDTFDCFSWSVRPAGALLRLSAADRVELTGSLRRRFRRGDAGAVSRVEIEVRTVKRLSPAR